MKPLFVLIAALLIILVSVAFFLPSSLMNRENNAKDFYVGVSFSGDTTAQAKILIDKVKGYTNLFVVDSGSASKNETMINEVCDYAVSSGLNILVYFGKFDNSWQLPWLDAAKQRWGNRFQGVYFFDEPAGSLLDGGNSSYFASNPPGNYDDMANLFVSAWQTMPGLATAKALENPPSSFTSDYALYWFDYLAGYDVVLAQFGWNHTRAQDVALARGAATVQGKSWGAITTWTYDSPPYLENASELYSDMVLAYEAGAKYIVVFNYPEINDYGILTEQHFEALERFWNGVQHGSYVVHNSAQTVLVLPRNYGWGMRNPNDTIWGLWGPDEKSPQIWNISRTLLETYGTGLDIVYDDANFSLKNKYSNIYYWNSTLP